MRRSVLEEEIVRCLAGTRARLSTHDRGVLLGFFLSLVPIFPIPLVGLAVGLFHAKVYRAGKLSEYDYRLSQKGILFAVVNTVIGAFLIFFAVRLVASADWDSFLGYMPRHLMDFLRALLHRSGPPSGGVSI